MLTMVLLLTCMSRTLIYSYLNCFTWILFLFVLSPSRYQNGSRVNIVLSLMSRLIVTLIEKDHPGDWSPEKFATLKMASA